MYGIQTREEMTNVSWSRWSISENIGKYIALLLSHSTDNSQWNRIYVWIPTRSVFFGCCLFLLNILESSTAPLMEFSFYTRGKGLKCDLVRTFSLVTILRAQQNLHPLLQRLPIWANYKLNPQSSIMKSDFWDSDIDYYYWEFIASLEKSITLSFQLFWSSGKGEKVKIYPFE